MEAGRGDCKDRLSVGIVDMNSFSLVSFQRILNLFSRSLDRYVPGSLLRQQQYLHDILTRKL